jgi:replicative DNA helicase
MNTELRVPPHSIDAEQSVIGGILLDSAAIDRVGGLNHSHFYRTEHRILFATMQRMSAANQQIDAVTVAEALDDSGQSELCGGLAYLGELACNTPSAANIASYAKIVTDRAIERQLLAANADIEGIIHGAGETRDKLHRAQSAIMSITEQAQPKQPRLIGDALIPFIDTLSERESGKSRGIPTGFADLDAKLRIQPGDVIVIAGRPAMGKTSIALQIALHFAETGTPTGVFSMEMSEGQLVDRVVATLGRVSMDSVLSGRVVGDDGDRITSAVARLQDLPLVIDDQGNLTIHELTAKARTMKRKFGIKALMVDYIGLMASTNDNRVQALGEISRSIKGLAKELQIPILLLSQLSRKCEERTDKRPILSDLRDTGDIEQDADAVLMIYRDEYYRPDTPDKGVAEVLIRKNRQGATGVTPLAFLGEYTRFENLCHEWRPQEAEAPKKGRRFD